jgi:hypothetical protein
MEKISTDHDYIELVDCSIKGTMLCVVKETTLAVLYATVLQSGRTLTDHAGT